MIAVAIVLAAIALPAWGPASRRGEPAAGAAHHNPRLNWKPPSTATATWPARASQPIMFVTGTGATGDQGYLIGQDAFERTAIPSVTSTSPTSRPPTSRSRSSTSSTDLRREFKLGGRKVAVGRDQPGRAAAAVRAHLLAGPAPQGQRRRGRGGHPARHQPSAEAAARPAAPCPPADWQQARRSNLLDALNSQPDETPGRRLVHDGPLAHRRDGPAAGRQAPDLGARRRHATS